jgi:hypothetical protein
MEKKVIDGCSIPLHVQKCVPRIPVEMHNTLEKQDGIHRRSNIPSLSLETSLSYNPFCIFIVGTSL